MGSKGCVRPPHMGQVPYTDRAACRLHCTTEGKSWLQNKTKTTLDIFDAFEEKKKIISVLAFKHNPRAQISFS